MKKTKSTDLLEKEIRRLKRENLSLTKEKESLERKLKTADETISDLKDEVVYLNREIDLKNG